MRLGVTYRAPGATKSGVVSLKGDVFQVISADQHGAYRLADDPDSIHTASNRTRILTDILYYYYCYYYPADIPPARESRER